MVLGKSRVNQIPVDQLIKHEEKCMLDEEFLFHSTWGIGFFEKVMLGTIHFRRQHVFKGGGGGGRGVPMCRWSKGHRT